MTATAIIGGSGLNALPGFELIDEQRPQTTFGVSATALQRGNWHGAEVWFLPRHGPGHRVPPHRVDYRANILALKAVGVEQVLASGAVGGITARMVPGRVVIPHQLIDYTWGRAHTLYEGDESGLDHVDFTEPFAPALRAAMLRAGGPDVIDGAVYGVTQGPRLETAAEIDRMERDGCDLVGMTLLPEAALAREAGLAYAAFCMVVNWAAGRDAGALSLDVIKTQMAASGKQAATLLKDTLPHLP